MAIPSNFTLNFLATNKKRTEIIKRQVSLQKQFMKILNILKKDPNSLIFHNKVSKKDAPNYYEIIKNPMDFTTLSKKFNLYRNLDEFKKDLDLIWENCLKYNLTGEYYINCANHMKRISDDLFLTRERVYPKFEEFNKIKGIEIFYYKEEIEKIIARYLNIVGIKKIEKEALEILTGLIDNEMIKITKKCKEDKKK